MITAFDQIVIDVPDLAAATEEYRALLGHIDTRGRIELGNINIQIRESAQAEVTRISELGLLDDELDRNSENPVATGPRDIPLTRSHLRDPVYREEPGETGIYAVDHLVLQTRDADDCIRLFRDELGIRLALDQEVPEWGGRMLFFRLGKMTLEVIHNLQQPPERDFFWGITYLCRDIDQTISCLDARGVAHSPIREGRKPGTRVATVKSHSLGLPTLLIGPA